MTEIGSKRGRRAFFLRGAAALGAGAGAAAAAAALPLTYGSPPPLDEQLKELQRQLDGVQAREAIHSLHRAFESLIEQQAYEEAAELFDEQAPLNLSGVMATGKPAILTLLTDQYRHRNAAVMHGAYRRNALQQTEAVTLSADCQQAQATFHVDVQLLTPLQGDCTAAKMARLQDHVADRRWEAGRFEAKYVKAAGEWKIAALSYSASSPA